MTREQIETFLKKHMVAIIAIGGGAIVIIVILIKRSQSSSQNGATLDTIHQDLKTIDFDINQIDTNLDTFPVSPAETPPAPKPVTPKQTLPIKPPVKPPASSDPSHSKPKNSDPKHKKKGKGGGFSWLVPQNKKVGAVAVPHPEEEQGMGLGGFVSNHADQWAVVDSWAMVGEEDYRTLYEAISSELYGFPGDLNNWVRLN